MQCTLPMTPAHDLRGKVALVTGASSGLGRHMAEVLAAAGASVGLAARRIEQLQQVAEGIRQRDGKAATAYLDVVDVGTIVSAVASIEAALGPIDILVNNSGVAIQKPALDTTEQDWDAVLDVNLKGAFLMAAEVARAM